MSYSKHTWVSHETITAAKLNNIEDGVEEAAQSGGGYDLVISSANNVQIGSIQASDLTIESGDILACEEKLINGETVNGVLILNSQWSFTPSGANTNKESRYIPLVNFIGPYCLIAFSGTIVNSIEVCAFFIDVEYNPETGEIVNVASNLVTLWGD